MIFCEVLLINNDYIGGIFVEQVQVERLGIEGGESKVANLETIRDVTTDLYQAILGLYNETQERNPLNVQSVMTGDNKVHFWLPEKAYLVTDDLYTTKVSLIKNEEKDYRGNITLSDIGIASSDSDPGFFQASVTVAEISTTDEAQLSEDEINAARTELGELEGMNFSDMEEEHWQRISELQQLLDGADKTTKVTTLKTTKYTTAIAPQGSDEEMFGRVDNSEITMQVFADNGRQDDVRAAQHTRQLTEQDCEQISKIAALLSSKKSKDSDATQVTSFVEA